MDVPCAKAGISTATPAIITQATPRASIARRGNGLAMTFTTPSPFDYHAPFLLPTGPAFHARPAILSVTESRSAWR